VIDIGGVALMLRVNLQDDAILVALGEDGRDLALGERIVERVVDVLDLDAEPRRGDAVDHHIGLQSALLAVGVPRRPRVPPVATALVALLLARENAAALAYVSGSLGTLIGADLLNLNAVRGLGAPVASIGGAGTFDGIFLTGIMAVLLAGISHGRESAELPAFLQ
jgi:hypothetical protein